MAGITVAVDTSHFNDSVRALSQISGTPIFNVMVSEVGHVLDRCVSLTTSQRADKIKRSIEFRNRTLKNSAKEPILYFTKSGVAWFLDEPGAKYEGVAKGKTIHGKTFHPMTEVFHYGDARWLRYQDFLGQLKANQINIKDVLGRIAFSWVAIGQSLGIDVKAPAYAKNFPPFKGRSYVDGRGKKETTAEGFFIEIYNANPVLLSTLDGGRILQQSINGRISYFDQNLRRGVFNDLKARAGRYPGVFVS